MAGSKKTINLSPLEKWRRLKDKVLEAASVDPKSATRKQSSAGPDGGPSFIPIQAPDSKGEATMIYGQGRDDKGKATMLSGQGRDDKGEATMLSGRGRASKGEATMIPGRGRASKGGATMTPGQERASKGGATMTPGQERASKGGATMIPGQERASKGGATMSPGQSRSHGASEPKMIRSGELRRRGAGGKMMAGTYRPSKNQITMLTTTRARPKLTPTARAVASTTVKTFIDELRSIATRQGMDFSTDQPDDMTVDLYTKSKSLRVSFTGREINIERIVVKDKERLHIAPATGIKWGMKSGGFDWDNGHPPEDADWLAPDHLIAIESHFIDTGENRDWRIELVNRAPDSAGKDSPGLTLTAAAARRLVMMLMDSLGSVAGLKEAKK